MTLQDHVIKGSGDFMETDSTLYIPILPKLTAIYIVLLDVIILVCHVILQDYVIYMVIWLYG